MGCIAQTQGLALYLWTGKRCLSSAADFGLHSLDIGSGCTTVHICHCNFHKRKCWLSASALRHPNSIQQRSSRQVMKEDAYQAYPERYSSTQKSELATSTAADDLLQRVYAPESSRSPEARLLLTTVVCYTFLTFGMRCDEVNVRPELYNIC